MFEDYDEGDWDDSDGWDDTDNSDDDNQQPTEELVDKEIPERIIPYERYRTPGPMKEYESNEDYVDEDDNEGPSPFDDEDEYWSEEDSVLENAHDLITDYHESGIADMVEYVRNIGDREGMQYTGSIFQLLHKEFYMLDSMFDHLRTRKQQNRYDPSNTTFYLQKMQTRIDQIKQFLDYSKPYFEQMDEVSWEYEDCYEGSAEFGQLARIAKATQEMSRKCEKHIDEALFSNFYEALGDLMDERNHIVEDGLADDFGAARRRLSKIIRSMPREYALEVIQGAIDRGLLSQQAAEIIIRDYVRSR